MRRPRAFAVLVIPALAAAAVLSSCGAVPDNAAVVNGHTISRSTLDGELEDIAANKSYVTLSEQGQLPGQQSPQQVLGKAPGTFDGTFVAQRLTNDILYELVREEVAKRGLTVTASDVSQARDDEIAGLTPSGGTPDQSVFLKFPARYQQRQIANVANQMVLERSLGAPAIDAAAIQAYFNQHQSDFPPASVCLSDIAVADQATAASIKAQLDSGADFATLAKQRSIDSQSAPNGGDDGCVPGSQLPTQILQQLAGVPVGKVSAPINNGTAYLLIKINGRTPATAQQLAPQIRQQMLLPAEQSLNTLILKLAKSAKVSVNPRYGTFHGQPDPTTGSIGVQPPPLTTVTTGPLSGGSPGSGASIPGFTPGTTTPGSGG